MTTTSNTNNNSIIKLSEGTMAGDVFYGSFNTKIKNKMISVTVSNHLKDINEKYDFRVAAKCMAGFVNISDWTEEPINVINSWSKNSIVAIQVKRTYGDGQVNWFNVLSIKNGKWYSIDLGFLKVMTVGTMRQVFPDMCDMSLWEMVNAKTWADKAFVQN